MQGDPPQKIERCERALAEVVYGVRLVSRTSLDGYASLITAYGKVYNAQAVPDKSLPVYRQTRACSGQRLVVDG
jgi:hypothetical protein